MKKSKLRKLMAIMTAVFVLSQSMAGFAATEPPSGTGEEGGAGNIGTEHDGTEESPIPGEGGDGSESGEGDETGEGDESGEGDETGMVDDETETNTGVTDGTETDGGAGAGAGDGAELTAEEGETAGAMMTAMSGGFTTMSGDIANSPGVDVLLNAFDITGDKIFARGTLGDPFVPNGGREALQALGIWGEHDYKGGVRAMEEYITAKSIEEYSSKRGFDISTKTTLGLGYSSKLFGSVQTKNTLTSESSYSSSYSTSYESFFSTMQLSKKLGVNTIPRSRIINRSEEIWNGGVFDDTFKDILAGEGNYANDPSSIAELFDVYGTHVITGYNFGGYAEQTMTIIKTDANAEETIDETFGFNTENNLKISGFEATVNANLETSMKMSSQSSNNSFSQNRYSVISGGVEDHKLALEYSDQTGLNNWMNSIQASSPRSSTEIFLDDSLQMIGIWELLPNTTQYAERKIELQLAYLEKARNAQNDFFNEFIYSSVSLTSSKMPLPDYTDAFSIIRTADDFMNIAANPAGHYILATDIDMFGHEWTQMAEFSGTLEGNGNTVSGLRIAGEAKNLFALNSGTIENIALTYQNRGDYISRAEGFAVLNEGTIEGCHVELIFDEAAAVRYAGTMANIPNTISARLAIIDLRGMANRDFGKAVILSPTVEAVKFISDNPSTIYTGFRLTVQGDTELIFENCHFVGVTDIPVISFTKLEGHPSIISQGMGNTIKSGVESNVDAIKADANLYIGGAADLSIEQGTVKASGLAAVYVKDVLTVEIDGKLNVLGGNAIANPAVAAQGATGTHASGRNQGGTGSNGAQGTAGFTGAMAIRAALLSILNESDLNLIGGNGGTGGQGGQGGTGGNGGSANASGSAKGGTGGTGGAGGRGGDGGTALVLSGDISIGINMSTASKLYMQRGIAGNGGKGGKGGTGGYGGNWTGLFAGAHQGGIGGNGGAGGIGGNGGYNGELEIGSDNINAIVNTGGLNVNGIISGGRGGDAGERGSAQAGGLSFGGGGGREPYGSAGGLGSAGVNSTAIAWENAYTTKGPEATSNNITWSASRMLIDTLPTLTYRPGELFDTHDLRLSIKTPLGTVPLFQDRVNVLYNFNDIGKTLVTVIGYYGGARFVRYIPVEVVPPTLEDVVFVRPFQTEFAEGEPFNAKGVAWELYYNNGDMRLLSEEVLTISAPPNATDSIGRKSVSVTYDHPDFSAYEFTYDIIVDDAIASIAVTGPPTKSTYLEGDKFDPSGMTLTKTYENSHTDNLPIRDAHFSHDIFDHADEAFAITASYAGQSTQFNVRVLPDPVTGLRVLRNPDKLAYFEGEIVLLNGIYLVADRQSGRERVLSLADIEWSPERPLFTSDVSITVRHFYGPDLQLHTANIPITVQTIQDVGIRIHTPPDKTVYIEDETFDATGMVVERIRNNGEHIVVAPGGYTVAPSVLTVDTRFVTITVGELAPVSIPVSVTAKVHAGEPQIIEQSTSATLTPNTEPHPLFVSATAPDDGQLSYQWYETTNANTPGTAIADATDSTFDAPIDTLGIYHYYVIVTNTINDNGDGGQKAASIKSEVISLTIANPVDALPPQIISQPRDISTHVGTQALLEVEALSPDSGALSYQWYQILDLETYLDAGEEAEPNEEETENIIAIEDAVESSFAAPTDAEGSFHYLVLVGNTIADDDTPGEKSAMTISEPATVLVGPTADPPIYRSSVPLRLEFDHGASVESITTALPGTVRIITDDENVSPDAPVSWNIAALSNYDPATRQQQNIVLSGSITLPAGIKGPADMDDERQINNAASVTLIIKSAAATRIILTIDYEREVMTGVNSALEYRFADSGAWTAGTADGAVSIRRFIDSTTENRHFAARIIGDPQSETRLIIPLRPAAPVVSADIEEASRGKSVSFSAAAGTYYSVGGSPAGAIGAEGQTPAHIVTGGSKSFTFWTPASNEHTYFRSRESSHIVSHQATIYTELTLNGAVASTDYENVLTKAIRVSVLGQNPDVAFRFHDYDNPDLPDQTITVNGFETSTDGWYTFKQKNGQALPVSIGRAAGDKNKLDNKSAIKDFQTILTLRELSGPNQGKEVDYIVVFDSQKPIIRLEYCDASTGEPIQYNGKRDTWKNGDIGIKVQISDDGSGVRGLSWKAGQKPAVSGSVQAAEFNSSLGGIYTYILTVPQQQGNWRISITAFDKTGKQTVASLPVRVDNNRPQNMSVRIGSAPSYEDVPFLTLRSFDQLSFAVNALAGSPLKKEYRIGDLDESTPGDGYAPLSALKKDLRDNYRAESELKIWFRVTNAGGKFSETYRELKKITLAKGERINKPLLIVGEHITWDAADDIKNPKNWSDEPVTFTVADSPARPIVDPEVGDNYLTRLTYKTSLRGAREMDIDPDGTFVLADNGNYRVVISAYDAYGNKTAAKAIRVRIDSEEPAIQKSEVRINKNIIEQGGVVYAPGGRLSSFAVRTPRQGSSVSAEWKIGNGSWIKKPGSVNVANGDKIWLRLTNAAGVAVEEEFAYVDTVTPAPLRVNVRIGGKTASSYGNFLTRPAQIDIAAKPGRGQSVEFRYILTDQANAPAQDTANWITYTPRSKPTISKNMKAYLHVSGVVMEGSNKVSDLGVSSFPVTLELSQDAGFSSINWITGWFDE